MLADNELDAFGIILRWDVSTAVVALRERAGVGQQLRPGVGKDGPCASVHYLTNTYSQLGTWTAPGGAWTFAEPHSNHCGNKRRVLYIL